MAQSRNEQLAVIVSARGAAYRLLQDDELSAELRKLGESYVAASGKLIVALDKEIAGPPQPRK